MATCLQSQNLAESKFNYFNYTLLYAECQTPFNPHEMDIEGKALCFSYLNMGRDTASDTT